MRGRPCLLDEGYLRRFKGLPGRCGNFCARVFRHEIRVPRFLLLFLWFSEAAGGGRDARSLKSVKNPSKKPPAPWRLFCAVSLAGNPGATPCRTTPTTFASAKSKS